MVPPVAFALSLAMLAFAGSELATAGRALGMPAALVSLLESLALGWPFAQEAAISLRRRPCASHQLCP